MTTETVKRSEDGGGMVRSFNTVKRIKVSILILILITSLVTIGLIYFFGPPKKSTDVAFKNINGLNYIIKQRFSGLDCSSTLWVGENPTGYTGFYLGHEEAYWWTGSIESVDQHKVLIKKNGVKLCLFDLDTSETVHFPDNIRRGFVDAL